MKARVVSEEQWDALVDDDEQCQHRFYMPKEMKIFCGRTYELRAGDTIKTPGNIVGLQGVHDWSFCTCLLLPPHPSIKEIYD